MATDDVHARLHQGEWGKAVVTLQATVTLLEAPASSLTQRVYNVSGVSFTPSMLAAEIKKHIPNFSIEYKPDFRQAIADSWPRSLDDSRARSDWGWKPEYDLAAMTKGRIFIFLLTSMQT